MFGKSVTLSWMLAGDFNAILSPEETTSVAANLFVRCAQFSRVVQYLGLVDLEFLQDPFTWCKGPSTTKFQAATLNRMLVSPDWIHLFPMPKVMHLERYLSDHCP